MADQAIIGDGKGLDMLVASALRAALEDCAKAFHAATDRKSTRLNSSHRT